MKRILSLLLIVTLLLPALVSCGKVRRLDIIENGECTLLYDPDTVAMADLHRLTDAIEELTGNKVRAERTGTPDQATILVGNVSLEEKGYTACHAIRNQDVFVGVTDDGYLIGGISTACTKSAITYFIESVLPQAKKDGQLLRVSSKDNYLESASYRMEGVTIGGVGLDDCCITLPEEPTVSQYRTAVLLKEHISVMTGYVLSVVAQSKATLPGRISIGQTADNTSPAGNDYSITVSGQTMYVGASSYLGYEGAQSILQSQVFHTRNKALQMTDSFALQGSGDALATAALQPEGDLRIMFSNIHGWPENGSTPVDVASEQLAELFFTYMPDILGTQEFTANSYAAGLDHMLEKYYTPIYETATALFYRTDTMELLDSGYLAFDDLTYNEYPTVSAGYTGIQLKEYNLRQTDGKQVTSSGRRDSSKGVTWGILRVKASGKLVMVGSTHLWWESNEDADEVTRAVQLMALRELLTSKANAFAAKNGLTSPIPIIAGGDYNTAKQRQNTALSVLGMGNDTFISASDVATVPLKASTHHAYAVFNPSNGIYEQPSRPTGDAKAAIDHIYVSSAATAAIKINRVGILTDSYALLSSDHTPIYTDISFLANAPTL